jgi:hypothetical protein
MPHAHTDKKLAEQPAIGVFAELGWRTVSTIGLEDPSHA